MASGARTPCWCGNSSNSRCPSLWTDMHCMSGTWRLSWQLSGGCLCRQHLDFAFWSVCAVHSKQDRCDLCLPQPQLYAVAARWGGLLSEQLHSLACAGSRCGVHQSAALRDLDGRTTCHASGVPHLWSRDSGLRLSCSRTKALKIAHSTIFRTSLMYHLYCFLLLSSTLFWSSLSPCQRHSCGCCNQPLCLLWESVLTRPLYFDESLAGHQGSGSWRWSKCARMARDGEIIQRQHFCHYGHNLPSKVRLRNNQTARNI